MEEIYVNTEYEKPVDARPRPTCQTAPESSGRRFYRAVVLLLGLLSVVLLAGIIALGVHSHDSSSEFSATKANLTERLQDREKQLNVKLTKLTKDLEGLQCFITQNRTCPAGWKVFGCSCYLFSTKTKTWDESRQDCRDRGADLVIVDRFGEQEFLTKNIKTSSWIGLSDRDNEGTWKWTDGTPLTQAYWGTGEPNNKGGEEHCGQLYTALTTERNWNDQDCDESIQWTCEK